MRRRFRRYFGTRSKYNETCAIYAGTCAKTQIKPKRNQNPNRSRTRLQTRPSLQPAPRALPYCSTGTTIMPSMSSTH